MKATLHLKGGEGSGNFDHAGRPGLVGGSSPQSSLSLDYSDDPVDFVGRFRNIAEEFEDVQTSAELSKLKRKWVKLDDTTNLPQGTIGAVLYFHKKNKARLEANVTTVRSAAEQRADRILHITDSTGKRSTRKW